MAIPHKEGVAIPHQDGTKAHEQSLVEVGMLGRSSYTYTPLAFVVCIVGGF